MKQITIKLTDDEWKELCDTLRHEFGEPLSEEEIDLQIKFHSILALNTYGFEIRRKDFKPEVVETFLRERMKHFDFDLPHEPLFGKSPGSWPKM